MSDIALLIDDLKSCSVISVCRICHEQEFESSKGLESPCACSGTVKFAHRDCIQRWCDEKGDTICEICLQKFKPGYTSTPKKTKLIDTTVIIRDNLGVARTDAEQEINAREDIETDHSDCASCCKLVALIFTALLLVRHLFGVITGGSGGYPFSLATVLIVKASGIILPTYVLIRILAVIHNGIKQHQYQDSYYDDSEDEEDIEAA